MKSLVTGSGGFIGSFLVKKLIELGDEVVCLDLKSGIDLKNYDNILPLFNNIDRVFHLAADISIEKCIEHPHETMLNNCVSTINVLEACKQSKVKKFIFSSTAALYKDLNKEVYFENDELETLNTYSSSKLTGENLCKIYFSLYGVKTTILRYFNVFGNGSNNYRSVLNSFKNQYENNNSLVIHGDGKQTRDFIYVEDVVDANIKASLIDGDSSIYNIGSGNSISIIELARKFSNNIIFKDARVGEVKHSRADISKASKDLNWKPSIDLIQWLK